jgi:hypothetical protein
MGTHGGTTGARRERWGNVYMLGSKGRTMQTEWPRGHGVSLSCMVSLVSSFVAVPIGSWVGRFIPSTALGCSRSTTEGGARWSEIGRSLGNVTWYKCVLESTNNAR